MTLTWQCRTLPLLCLARAQKSAMGGRESAGYARHTAWGSILTAVKFLTTAYGPAQSPYQGLLAEIFRQRWVRRVNLADSEETP